MRAAVYARVSGTDDPRDASLDTQVEATQKKFRELGYVVEAEDVYVEKYTGTNLHDRPEMSRMRQGVLAGRYQAYGVYCLDRLSRNATHLSVLFDEAERHGCQVISATEEIDKTPEGVLMRNIRGYVAEVERLKILDRTARGTARLLEQGLLICSGLPRFGYRYDKETRTRESVHEEAVIVRRIFSWAADGWSVRKICQALNAEGVPSPSAWRGKVYKRGASHWVKDTVSNLLRDRSYIGEPMVWHKTKVVGRKKSGRPEVAFTDPREQKSLGDPTPRIVDDETFEAAQLTFNRQKTYAEALNDLHQFRMLRGMIFCGKCGRTLTTQKTWKWKKRGHYHWYLCMAKRDEPGAPRCDNPRMQIEQVESEVWRQVEEFLRDKDAVRNALDATRNTDGPLLEHDLENHRRGITEAEKMAARLVKRLGTESDEMVARLVRDELAAITRTVTDHRTAITELETRIAARDHMEDAVRSMEAFLNSGRVNEVMGAIAGGEVVGSDWETTLKEMVAESTEVTPQEKRQVLMALGAKVYVTDQAVRVELAIPVAIAGLQGGGTGRPAAPAAWASR
jgi:site-specific DNA recombinase